MKGILLQHGRGDSAANPLATDMDVMLKLQEMCGAEGMRYEGGMVVAIRFDTNGNEIVIDRFQVERVKGNVK